MDSVREGVLARLPWLHLYCGGQVAGSHPPVLFYRVPDSTGREKIEVLTLFLGNNTARGAYRAWMKMFTRALPADTIDFVVDRVQGVIEERFVVCSFIGMGETKIKLLEVRGRKLYGPAAFGWYNQAIAGNFMLKLRSWHGTYDRECTVRRYDKRLVMTQGYIQLSDGFWGKSMDTELLTFL